MESPGLFTYQAAKHGVLGLMRSLRLYTPSALGLRVNAICPWMTATALVAGIQDAWYKAELPVNQPIDVAKVIMNVLRLKGLNGKAMYVEGGRAWEIEGGIERTMAGCGGEDGWLGLDQVKELERGQKVLADVSCLLCCVLIVYVVHYRFSSVQSTPYSVNMRHFGATVGSLRASAVMRRILTDPIRALGG